MKPFLFMIFFSTFLISTMVWADASSEEEIVTIHRGMEVPGCEDSNECFDPYQAKVEVGGKVTWSNESGNAMLISSGSPERDGTTDYFYSGVFWSGNDFSHTFEDAGLYPYFCMIHPWMQGEIKAEHHVEELYCGKTIDQFANVIYGTDGNDILIGTKADDLMIGWGGYDYFDGKGGRDCYDGGDDSDYFLGSYFYDPTRGDDIMSDGTDWCHDDKRWSYYTKFISLC